MAKLDLELPKITLNDGTTFDMIGYGLGTAQSKKDENSIDKELVEHVKTAIKVGFRHLDGAEAYQNETEIGRAIKECKVPREELFVVTKVNQGLDDIPKALENSLKKLGLDYVDLYLIHKPFFGNADEDLQKAWKDMEELQKAGKAKSIGVSNYLQKHLEATLKTAKVVPSINQIEFHHYLQHGDLVPWCQSKGIAVSGYGPITAVTRARPGPVDDLLAALAKKYAVNEAEICLRWCIDQNIAPITTTAKEQRMSDYLRTATFKLTPKEVQELKEEGAKKHYRGFWKGKYDENDRS